MESEGEKERERGSGGGTEGWAEINVALSHMKNGPINECKERWMG